MAFDPCREWLGIDTQELADPCRVLGLPPGGGDADAILGAAERRLEALRRVSPGPFAKAHAALLVRVEEARDNLLGEAMEAPLPTFSVRRAGRSRRRRSADTGGLLLSMGILLGLAFAVLLLLFMRPELWGSLFVPLKKTRPVAAQGVGALTKPPQDAEPQRPRKETALESDQQAAALRAEENRRRRADEAEAQARREAKRADQARREEAARMAERESQRVEAERTAEERRRADAERARMTETLNGGIEQAYQALRREEFAAADGLLANLERQLGDDVEATGRLERWKLFATYAKEFSTFREQAFTAANEGREYEIDGTPFAVVEITPAMLIYKRAGRIERVPREKIDPRIPMAIVEAWFAVDGRAANHLFLGAHWLCLDPPDTRWARTAWQAATAGGADASPLLALLDDPVIQRPDR